jgi:hypothetical protein
MQAHIEQVLTNSKTIKQIQGQLTGPVLQELFTTEAQRALTETQEAE